jgi:hypothetical protein
MFSTVQLAVHGIAVQLRNGDFQLRHVIFTAFNARSDLHQGLLLAASKSLPSTANTSSYIRRDHFLSQ